MDTCMFSLVIDAVIKWRNNKCSELFHCTFQTFMTSLLSIRAQTMEDCMRFVFYNKPKLASECNQVSNRLLFTFNLPEFT